VARHWIVVGTSATAGRGAEEVRLEEFYEGDERKRRMRHLAEVRSTEGEVSELGSSSEVRREWCGALHTYSGLAELSLLYECVSAHCKLHVAPYHVVSYGGVPMARSLNGASGADSEGEEDGREP